MKKINVNGNDAHPIFKYLKSQTKGLLGSAIKWNFTKFLVSKDGETIKRYAPTTKPEKLEKDIESML
jgi:glutathione peroxidase